jgi:hypothetical protein
VKAAETVAVCGTRSGYQKHVREDTSPCTPCRIANREYMRKYRERPGVMDKELDRNLARSRALWRLAHLHPTQFAILVDEEMGR